MADLSGLPFPPSELSWDKLGDVMKHMKLGKSQACTVLNLVLGAPSAEDKETIDAIEDDTVEPRKGKAKAAAKAKAKNRTKVPKSKAAKAKSGASDSTRPKGKSKEPNEPKETKEPKESNEPRKPKESKEPKPKEPKEPKVKSKGKPKLKNKSKSKNAKVKKHVLKRPASKKTIELEDWEEQGEEEPHTEDQEVVPEPPRKRRAPLADPELGDDVELPAPSPMDHTGEEHMAETAEDEPKPAEAAAPQDVECEMEVGKDLDKSSSPPETMPGTLNAEPVPGDMSFPLQDSQGTLLSGATFLEAYKTVPANELDATDTRSVASMSTIPLGGDALQPHDPEWLKQQNAELQRQLREAHARLDAMHARPELRRTKLTGEAADKPLFDVEDLDGEPWTPAEQPAEQEEGPQEPTPPEPTPPEPTPSVPTPSSVALEKAAPAKALVARKATLPGPTWPLDSIPTMSRLSCRSMAWWWLLNQKLHQRHRYPPARTMMQHCKL